MGKDQFDRQFHPDAQSWVPYPDRRITLPKFGIQIIPPAETATNMQRAETAAGLATWSDREKARLQLLRTGKILSSRYPTPEHGQEFMLTVDDERRRELIEYGRTLTAEVVSSSVNLFPDKDIAVIVYGSIPRGLVKGLDHPVPSDIDLLVTGDISNNEKIRFSEAIFPTRVSIGKQILAGSTLEDGLDDLTAATAAGVKIQSLETLRKDDYSAALNYVRHAGRAVYDPANLWGQLENDALDSYIQRPTKEKKFRYNPSHPREIFNARS